MLKRSFNKERIAGRATVSIALATMLWGISLVAKAADQGQAVETALHFLGELNRVSPLEPAGSHGSLGTGLGAGAASYVPPSPNAVTRAELGRSSGTNTDAAYLIPRIYLVKGLPLPVDLGFTGGTSSESGFSQASGSLQWTFYEALAMPALAVRASYGRLYGLVGTQLETSELDLVASYGFLRYFTLYGRYGAALQQGSLRVDEAGPLAFLDTDQPAETIERTWMESVRGAGLRIMVLPPFVALTAEAELGTGTGARSYAAKLSIGL